MSQKVRIKPTEYEAVQYTGENGDEINNFTNRTANIYSGKGVGGWTDGVRYDYITLPDITGGYDLIFLDGWILKDADGNLIFIEEREFNKLYEVVNNNE